MNKAHKWTIYVARVGTVEAEAKNLPKNLVWHLTPTTELWYNTRAKA